MQLVSEARAAGSCFLKAGGRGALLWTIPANSGAVIRTKVSSVSARKLIRVAWKSKTWRWRCGHAAITVEMVKPGTKMRGNACLEKHPCPHLLLYDSYWREFPRKRQMPSAQDRETTALPVWIQSAEVCSPALYVMSRSKWWSTSVWL